MSSPHGSIPGYKPGPILSGPKKAFVASLFVLPVGAYALMRWQQIKAEREQVAVEELGRRNWSEAEKIASKDLGVRVGRSGGGI